MSKLTIVFDKGRNREFYICDKALFSIYAIMMLLKLITKRKKGHGISTVCSYQTKEKQKCMQHLFQKKEVNCKR